MASVSTDFQSYFHDALQRLRDADLVEISELALAADDELSFGLISGTNAIVNGFVVGSPTSRNFPVGAGIALYAGRLIKYRASPSLSAQLDEEPGANPRIDIIYISGFDSTEDTSATRVFMSSITRTDVSGEAVGTGDNSTKIWSLDYANVDPHTLKVYLDGTQVGGWNYSKGTGGGFVDQIIFETAPGSSVAITASYTRQSGGSEASASGNTRKTWTPTFGVAKGTPASSPAADGTVPAGGIPVAHVQVPAGWTGGSSGVTISNALDANGDYIKPFLVHPDKDNSANSGTYADYYPGEGVAAGRISTALRGISQIVHGCRLQYISSSAMSITAGWGVMGGASFKESGNRLITITGSDIPSAGWYYVYGQIDLSSNAPAGRPFDAIQFSTDPPDSLRRHSNSEQGCIYLGAVYGTASGAIRAFYTHGDWMFWPAPSAIAVSSGTNDQDVSAWCPKTGRLLHAKVVLAGIAAGAGGHRSLTARSHKDITALYSPSFGTLLVSNQTTDLITVEDTGFVRAEDDSGTRYVNTQLTNLGTYTDEENDLYVLGYLDDYRTMNGSGAATFY